MLNDKRNLIITLVLLLFTGFAATSLIKDCQDRYQRNIYFVDKKGGIAVFGYDSAITATDIHAMEGLGSIAPLILQKGAGNFQYQRDGLDHLLNVRFIPGSTGTGSWSGSRTRPSRASAKCCI